MVKNVMVKISSPTYITGGFHSKAVGSLSHTRDELKCCSSPLLYYSLISSSTHVDGMSWGRNELAE